MARDGVKGLLPEVRRVGELGGWAELIDLAQNRVILSLPLLGPFKKQASVGIRGPFGARVLGEGDAEEACVEIEKGLQLAHMR